MTSRLGIGVSVALVASVMAAGRASAQATSIVFDDFNIDEGRFNRSPGFSGSSNGFQKTAIETVDPDPVAPNPSTAVHDTTDSADTFGTGGSQKLEIFDDLDQTTLEPNGGTARVRNLSGTGVADPVNAGFVNTRFQTSAEVDGWIGVAVKTLDPGWTVQLWIEVSANTADTTYNNNGGVPKDVINDGQWHIYQWDLDDATGGEDGWGTVGGIIAGGATVADDFHTIDSIVFRQSDFSQIAAVDNVRKSTIFMDYVVKTAAGMITLPEPPMGDADFDGDDDIDGADFLILQRNMGALGTGTPATGDANNDTNVDAVDLGIFKAKFGTTPVASPVASPVPEPASWALAALALAGALAAAKRRQRAVERT